MSKYKRDYFEEMNIDYEELKDYKDVETYYDEIQDFTNLLKELQCDRVECQKYIVRANKEIERLNNIINELEKESHLGMLENQNNNDYAKGLYCAYEYINQKIIKLKEGKE